MEGAQSSYQLGWVGMSLFLLFLLPSAVFAHGGLIFPHIWQVKTILLIMVGSLRCVQNPSFTKRKWGSGVQTLVQTLVILILNSCVFDLLITGLWTSAVGQDDAALEVPGDEREQNRGPGHGLEALGVVHQRHAHPQQAGHPLLDARLPQNEE